MAGQTVAVLGAGGFVGRYVCRELVARGHSVRGLARDRSASRAVVPGAVELVTGDVADPAALRSLLHGPSGRVDAVVNCVGIIREAGGGQTFEKIHVAAVRELVGAMRQTGVDRIVHVSAQGVWDEGPSAYQKTKFEGELIIRRSDLRWSILRPSIVHGVGSEFLTMAKGWVSGDAPPWLFMPYFVRGEVAGHVPLAPLRRVDPKVQPVAVEDVAIAAAACLEREDSIGEIYPLVGPEVLDWPEMLRVLRDTLPGGNHALEPVGIPCELAALQAKVMRRLGLGWTLPFDEGMALMGGLDNIGSHEKARAHLGLEPRPFVATLRGYASQV